MESIDRQPEPEDMLCEECFCSVWYFDPDCTCECHEWDVENEEGD